MLKVIFSKDDFQLSPGDKTRSRQHIINVKAIKTQFLRQTTFIGKIVFPKEDFQLAYFSNYRGMFGLKL